MFVGYSCLVVVRRLLGVSSKFNRCFAFGLVLYCFFFNLKNVLIIVDHIAK